MEKTSAQLAYANFLCKCAEGDEESDPLGDMARKRLYEQIQGEKMVRPILGGMGIGTGLGAGVGALAGALSKGRLHPAEGALMGGMTGMALGPLGGAIYGTARHSGKSKEEAAKAWEKMQSGGHKGISINLNSPYYY